MIKTGNRIEYEIPTLEICPISSQDVIKTSGETEPPTLPGYSGSEWDPF